jgi:hypothetical protein
MIAFLQWSWVMPVTYNIDTAAKVIRTTCSRPLTFAEVVEHFRALGRDPVCAGYLDVFLDVSDVDLLPTSTQFGPITAEMAAIRDKVQFGTCAIVATQDAMFGMMRIFEVLAGRYFLATRVFRGKHEAEAWLAAQRIAGGQQP